MLVENPTYLAALLAWRPLGARIEGLPGGDGGLLPAALEAAIPGARAIYTMPNFQNPRGTTLALTRRRDLVRLARQAGCVILEDDPYGQLRYAGEPLPHLLDIDAAQSSGDPDDWAVIRAGTFSKVLAPGLRIGWLIGPEVVIDKMVQAKQAADLHTSTLNQLIALELAAAGFLDRQIPKLCAAYGQRRDAMFTALARYMPPGIRWTKPEGGMFLFLTLPPGGDATQLLAECLRRQAAYVPGEDFHTDDSGRNTLRLNFSNAAPEMIEEGIRRIAEVFAEGLAAV